MRTLHTIFQLLIVAAMLAACASAPRQNAALDEARSQYNLAQSDPQVVSLAAIELQRAGDALGIANQAWEHRDKTAKVDELAHIAKEKIDVARNVAQQKAAEATIASAAKQRDQLIIDQRTKDADKATAAAREADNRARQLEAQLMELAAKKTDRGMVVTLNDVLFNTNKSELNPGGIRTVQKLADILTQNPDRTILVEGFTDSTGTAGYNLELSARRANAVRDALMGMGIASNRIVARGLGKEYPVAGNETASGRQLNRRVEIIFPNETGNSISQK
ncbi:MAG TPA: OmpA family protein [Burkholderiaceae bacterium]|jgi:outer membrane protein OmpA-like peptidoglycan-associated protein|nr:OmpA family protein [Burkholderiaceae bacterium]